MQTNHEIRDAGTYLEIDGRAAVRFERVYRHSLQHVWRAVTDPAEMRHWFPSPEISYEPRVGGAMTLGGDPYAEGSSTGKVLAWDPPHRFGFEWGPDELQLTLSETDGGCRLELVDYLSETGAAARNAAGWEVCLDELRKAVDGHAGAGPHSDETLDFRPLLERYRAEGLPDDGWLPDGV
jgi:uncharacterized protein YndB with AHSA1/START domain